MKRFLLNTLSSTLGTMIALVLSFFFFIALIAGLASAFGDMEGKPMTTVKPHSVLHLKLDKPVKERVSDNQMQFSLQGFGAGEAIGLNQFIEHIDRAKSDENIEGIYLDLSVFSSSMSTAYDMRNALKDFKTSGKWIVAYGETWTLGNYYMATVADELYLYPEGILDFRGLSAELMFFKNMLDKLGVEVQVIRGPNNKYKSAVEPFMYDKMSEGSREQMTAMLADFWDVMLNDMSESRGISKNEFNEIADGLKINLPSDALEYGLVDGLKYYDEVNDILSAKLGDAFDAKDRLVSFSDYSRGKSFKGMKPPVGKSRVAVVYAVGEIVSGEGDDDIIGSERISEALREARLDENVAAIVLRVNSPGGSALASDVIWRETQLIKAAGIPFVVSMGDVAASGGYYIACGADKIFANENTVTGSIGVFGVLPNAQRMLNEKLGITFDYVETNTHADMLTMTKGLDEYEMDKVNRSIHYIYDDFTQKVADGRGMTQEAVDKIAQGRVWSGKAALEVGLVDSLGNLQAAVEYAAQMAALTDYRTKDYPRMLDPIEKLLKDFGMETQMQAAAEMWLLKDPAMINEVLSVKRMLESQQVQARMPYVLRIR